MLYNCYLRNGVVYVPTVVKLTTGAYVDVEPVSTVAVANTNGLQHAIVDAIGRGNAIVPPPPKDNWPPPVLLRYAGVKTWAAFARQANEWSIREKGGIYEIVAYRDHPDGYWAEDRERTFELPAGSSAEDAVERMIAILQGDARQR